MSLSPDRCLIFGSPALTCDHNVLEGTSDITKGLKANHDLFLSGSSAKWAKALLFTHFNHINSSVPDHVLCSDAQCCSGVSGFYVVVSG